MAAFGGDRRLADAEEDEPRVRERAPGDVRSRHDAGHGVVAGAARQLENDGALLRLAPRKLDGGDQLVVGKRRSIEAGEELGRGDAPLALGAARNDGRHRAPRSRPAARRRDRRRPASRRWCRGCGWRDGRSAARPRPAAARAGGPDRWQPSSAWVVSAPTLMPSPAAEMPASSATREMSISVEGSDRRKARVARSDCPPASSLRVGAGRAPEREDVGKRARPDIGERRRFHRWLLPGRTFLVRGFRAVYGPVPPASRLRCAQCRDRTGGESLMGRGKEKGESVTMEGDRSRLARSLRGKRSGARSLTGEEETYVMLDGDVGMLRGRAQMDEISVMVGG